MLITFTDSFIIGWKCLIVLFARYAGEVNVAQAELPAFLKTAERLKVKGLAEVNQNDRQDR